jgi:hypothetical protein
MPFANERPGTNGFTAEFYQVFKEEFRAIFLNLFQKIKEEGTEGIVPNTFFEVRDTLPPKTGKRHKERKTTSR